MPLNYKTNDIQQLLVISIFLGVGVSYSTIYLFHIILTIYLLFVTANITRKKLTFKIHISEIFFILLPIIYFISVFWVQDYGSWARYCIYASIAISCFFIAKSALDAHGYKMVLNWIFIIYIIQLLICTLETLTSFRWPISPYSDVVTYFGRTNSFSDISNETITYLKNTPTGFQWNPNNLAFVICIYFPFIANLYHGRLKYLIFPLVVFIIISTGSRIMVLTIALYLIYLLLKKSSLVKYITAMMVIYMILIDLTLLGYIKSSIIVINDLFHLITNTEIEKLSSIGIRYNLYLSGIQAFWESNLVGIGAGGLVSMFRESGGFGPQGVISPHNYWLELFVDGGLLLGLLFVFWWLSVYNKLRLNNYNKSLNLSCKESLFLIIPAALGPSSCVYILPLWFLLGLISYTALSRELKNE